MVGWSVQLPLPAPPASTSTSPPASPCSIPLLFSFRLANYISSLYTHRLRTLLPSCSVLDYTPFPPYVLTHLRDNSLTFSGLLSAHLFQRARHPLQVSFSPLNISSTLCPFNILNSMRDRNKNRVPTSILQKVNNIISLSEDRTITQLTTAQNLIKGSATNKDKQRTKNKGT